jgi:hypothetical protein
LTFYKAFRENGSHQLRGEKKKRGKFFLNHLEGVVVEFDFVVVFAFFAGGAPSASASAFFFLGFLLGLLA